MNFSEKDFSSEFEFKTSRSSGKGGQHVNKTESRVSLFFSIDKSQLLSEEEKKKLSTNATTQISNDGFLQIDVEEHRSQAKNKKRAIEKFYQWLREALKPVKRRKATKPTKAAIRKRLKNKKLKSEKKQNRRLDF